MVATKIQDEQEVVRWFEAGWTYRQMCEEYERKYHLEVVPSTFGNFRRRKGLDRRIARNDNLIPWEVKREHRWAYPVMMLRMEARRRGGHGLSPEREHSLDAWIANLQEQDAVVHYDPDTDQGWFYVPRRKGVDTDLIRTPERKTTSRRNADDRTDYPV